MPAFLLDTNVLSEIVRPRPSRNVEAFLEREGDLWLSVVTLHELAYGVALSADAARRLKLQTWIESVKNKFGDRILDVTPAIAETAGRLRGFSQSEGRVLSPLDALIAATAAVQACALATRNVRDFEHLGVGLFNPWED